MCKDTVVAKMTNLMRFQPMFDSCGDEIGTEFVSLLTYDPAGSLP